jgi:hypothetical protein
MRLGPRAGWQAWVVDQASFLAWNGSAWNAAGLPAFLSDAVNVAAFVWRDHHPRDVELDGRHRLDAEPRRDLACDQHAPLAPDLGPVVDSAADQRSGVFTCWRGNAAGLGGWTFVTRLSLATL